MKNNMLKALVVLLCATVFTAKAQLKEVNGFENPESVMAYGNKLYVTNLGAALDPTAKDGDGYISVINRKNGKMIKQKFITGLNSPKGIQVGWGRIAVTDVDKVIVFNIHNGKKIREYDLASAGITYANDMAIGTAALLVSSTDQNAVYRLKHSNKTNQMLIKVDLPGANGIKRCGNKLYVANYGRNDNANGSFGVVNRTTKKFTLLQAGGAYDGVTKIGKHLVLSDWVSATENKGRLVVYDLHKKKSWGVNIGRTIDGPADIYADKTTRLVWVPAMRENKLLAVSFNSITK